jgi:HD-GYP domain-containing protein (c-di-GMP phosphodiesterase class II)
MPPSKRLSGRAQALLAHLGRQLAGETKLESLLGIMTQEVQGLVGAARCRIYLDPRGERCVGSVNGASSLPAAIERAVRHGIQAGTSVRLEGQAGGIKNLLAAPILGHGGKVLGYIEVANKKRGVFDDDDEGLLMLLASITGHAMDNERLNRDLQDSHLETIYRLATVAEYRDKEDLAGHLRRMSRYSALIAEGVGLSKIEARRILYASPLHDIGKVAIPDAVLLKPGKLSTEEYEVIKTHTVLGAEILKNAKSELLKVASRIALCHHEKFDGSGYPKGLKGNSIPLEARIASVADVFDALSSRRVYKEAWSHDEVRKYFAEQTGKAFDPKVVEALEAMWPRVKAIMKEEWPDWGKGRSPMSPADPHRHHDH